MQHEILYWWIFEPNLNDVYDYMVKGPSDHQPFDCTTFFWKYKLFMVINCAWLRKTNFPWSNIATVGTIFKVFKLTKYNHIPSSAINFFFKLDGLLCLIEYLEQYIYCLSLKLYVGDKMIHLKLKGFNPNRF